MAVLIAGNYPTIYIKLWPKVCLSTSLLDTQLLVFVLKICDMRLIQSEIEYGKLLFLFSRLILKEHESLV